MNRDFAGLCTEHETLEAYDVTDIKQFLEHHIVQVLVFARTYFVTSHIHLDTTGIVLQFDKRGLSHDAAAHYATCYTYLTLFGCVIFEVGTDVCRGGIHRIKRCRVWFYTHLAQRGQRIAAYRFLFAKFEGIHIWLFFLVSCI